MKKIITLVVAFVAITVSVDAQNINLPAPETAGGLPVNQALSERKSVREFDSARSLPLQTVSNILWAACGINRTEKGMRTNPTARNLQEVDAYWFDTNGIYYYDFKTNTLVEKVKGDFRGLIAGGKFKQEFVMDAPAAVVLVADTTKSDLTASLIDAGIACENINIFCAGNGLATIPRMTMDVNEIQKLLSLPETTLPILNNPVGYAK